MTSIKNNPGAGDAGAQGVLLSNCGSNGAENATNATLTQAAAVRVEQISVACIKDGGAQMRVEMRPETVGEYAQDMLDGAAVPAAVVFHDGYDYWLADGFHRF